MLIKDTVISAQVVGRYNHLIIDAKLPDASIVPVFCSSYDIAEMCQEGRCIYISKRTSTEYNIPYEIEFVLLDTGMVYAKPNNNNNLFEEAFRSGIITEFSQYTECRKIGSEDKLPHIDFELSNSSNEKCFVFVTNIYKKQADNAVFPGKINFFELEMLETMRYLRAQGYMTYVFMIVPRMDCNNIRFIWNEAPLAAGKIFEEAKNGLNFVGYSCNIKKMSVTISNVMPILY